MCMKTVFSTRSKHVARFLIVVVACGLTWSCKDDFPYDEEKPSWLNTSIYEGLESRGNFSTYLRLLADPDVNEEGVDNLQEVLSRTGSKTVFVANDEAWQAFFDRNKTLPATNPWHTATSYENLSEAQKLLLIHTSMLNNAIVMENLASSDGSQQKSPTRGEYMRRYTDYTLWDSITYLPADQIPHSYSPVDKDYWARFRTPGLREGAGYTGAYLVNDSTRNMMLHFTSEHMTKQDVTDADFKIFMGRERATTDVHIYDALLEQKDIVAENGYVNITERVLAPLPNMAEVIRTNGRTNIFSHMLDRFSFPYYNRAVTLAYNRLHPTAPIDSIFTKKYFSNLGPDHKPVIKDPSGEQFKDGNTALKFDPGWNEFYDEANVRADMAAMFVPEDEVMWNYFKNGGGKQLIQTYSSNPDANVPVGDYDALYQQIDEIPLGTLQALLNVIMFRSFTGSVPSKMTKLRNDAQEDIFSLEDIQNIDTCYLACNGAVYLMKKVYNPADYASVAAPAYISKTNLIMKWAIYNGSVESSDQMKLNYYAYLKAMKSRFTLFLPSDEALLRYYDPVSFTSQKARVLSLTFTGKDDNWDLTKKNSYKLYRYNVQTATQGDAYSNETMTPDEIVNRLKDILESHTIVHDGTNPIDSENEYYITKNGSAVKVTRDETGKIIAVQGGYQLENERQGIVDGSRGTLSINVPEANIYDMENGRTYVIDDCPIIPPSKSVYGVLNSTEDAEGNLVFDKFYELTQPVAEIIRACGLVNGNLPADDQARIEKRFYTFVDDGGVDQNVQFFNNYRYTVFVPTAEALEEAVANGLPTWESIQEDYESLPVDESERPILTLNDSLRLQAKITYLNNFLRGHFLDNSVFADKTEMSSTDFVTSSYNTELGVFVKVHVRRAKSGGKTILYVRDDNGGKEYAATDYCNIMARDISCQRNNTKTSPTGATSMNNLLLQGSSFAVIHQIDGVLNHVPLLDKDGDGVGETYGINWNSPAACKRYLQQYAIR